MSWESPLLIIAFMLVAMVAMFMAGEAWRKRNAPGSMSFSLLMLSVTVWLLASAGNLAATTLEHKLFWSKIEYLGICWLATLWLMFAVEFAYQHSKIVARYGGLLWIIPSLTMILVFTNDLHHLYWSSINVLNDGRIVYNRGIWFWVFVPYNYLLLALGAGVLVSGLLRYPYYHRRQIAALVLGMLLPWLANISYMAGWAPLGGLDMTPFTFSITGILYTWVIFRMRLFDPVPLARDAILEQIDEGYLAFDGDGRVLDANPTARLMLDLGSDSITGRHYSEVLRDWPELVDLINGQGSYPMEVKTGGTSRRFFEANVSPWQDSHKQSSGNILFLYDITRRINAEKQLRASEQQYRLLVNLSPVGITAIDRLGRVTFASPETVKLFGGSGEEILVGRDIIDLIHPDERQSITSHRDLFTMGNGPLSPLTYQLVKFDGTTFLGEITATPLPAVNGAGKGVLCIIRDVTHQKELELRVKRNLEYKTFINQLLELEFNAPKSRDTLYDALELTGRFFNTSRVYLCQDSQDGSETSITSEWCSGDLLPRAQEAPLLRYASVPALRDRLNMQELVICPACRVEEDHLEGLVSEDLNEFTTTWNARSFLAMPVPGIGSRRYGFLGLDDCVTERQWSSEEIDLLWNVNNIISGAVAQIEIEKAEQNQRLMTEALQDTMKALNSTLNPEEVLDRVLSNLEKVVKSDAASIALLDESGGVRFVRWRGYDRVGSDIMLQEDMHISHRETYRWMSLTGEAIVMADTWLDKRWLRQEEFAWIRSYAGVPIVVKGKVTGFLNLDSGEPDSFSQEDCGRLRVFADQAGIALENARLYNLASQRAEQMTSLYRIGMSLTTGLEMENVLHSLFDQCRQILPIDVFYVFLYEAEHDRLSPGIYYEKGEFLDLESALLAGPPSLTRIVINDRKTLVIQDTRVAEEQGLFQLRHVGGKPARSYVAVPLIMFDQVVGVISMQNYQPDAYTDEQVRLLETIATQAAITVQNARMYEQMRQMAITDSVTQLFTRRHFTVVGHNEIERALRYHRAASLLMVDIDWFKKVNDTFGHFTGDLVLQVVAKTCSQALRATDIVGRWGGEEFTIVLPEADKDGAMMIAERIRRMVEACPIPVADGEFIHVTVSLGAATLGSSCSSLEALVDCADHAMYAAKQAGRNQVKAFDDLPD